jgi:hypothetical protein
VSHFGDRTQFRRLTGLAGVKVWEIPEYSALELDWPIDAEAAGDIKQAVWAAFALGEGCVGANWTATIDVTSATSSPPSLCAVAMADVFARFLKSHAAAVAPTTVDVDTYMLFSTPDGADPSLFFVYNPANGTLEPELHGVNFVAVSAEPRKKLLFTFEQESASTSLLTVYRSF